MEKGFLAFVTELHFVRFVRIDLLIGEEMKKIVHLSILRRMLRGHVRQTLIEIAESLRTTFDQTTVERMSHKRIMHFVHVKIEKKITRKEFFTLRTEMLMMNVMVEVEIGLAGTLVRTVRTGETRRSRRGRSSRNGTGRRIVCPKSFRITRLIAIDIHFRLEILLRERGNTPKDQIKTTVQ